MDFRTIAVNMWPNWLLGIAMIATTYFSQYRNLIKVDFKAVRKWITIMIMISAIRIVMLKTLAHVTGKAPVGEAVAWIPWQATLTVFWEDAAHTLPVALIGHAFGESFFYYAAMLFMMVNFGLGHVYQGYGAAMMLAMYIPITISLAKKYGFGTMMICHTIYDLATILTVKYVLGLL